MKDLLSYLIPVVLYILGWASGRRKSKAETELVEMQATEKAVAIWRQLAQDLKTEVKELRTLVDELKEENEKLQEEINQLKTTIK